MKGLFQEGLLLRLRMIPVAEHFQIELFHRRGQAFVIAGEIGRDGVVKEKQLFLHHFGLGRGNTLRLHQQSAEVANLILFEELHLDSHVTFELLVLLFGLGEFSLHFSQLRAGRKHFQFSSTGIVFQSEGKRSVCSFALLLLPRDLVETNGVDRVFDRFVA